MVGNTELLPSWLEKKHILQNRQRHLASGVLNGKELPTPRHKFHPPFNFPPLNLEIEQREYEL
jgi:hypothetical protein